MASTCTKDASEELKRLHEVVEKQRRVIETLENLNLHKNRQIDVLREEVRDYEECSVGIMGEMGEIESSCRHLEQKCVTLSEENRMLKGEVEEFKSEASDNFRHLMVSKWKSMVLQRNLSKAQFRLLESNRQLFNARTTPPCCRLGCYCSDPGKFLPSLPPSSSFTPHPPQVNMHHGRPVKKVENDSNWNINCHSTNFR